MQALKAVEVFKHRLDYLIDHLFVYISGGNKSGSHTEGGHIFVITAIHPAGNGSNPVVWILINQFFRGFVVDRHNGAVTGRGSFLDRTGRVSNGIEEGIDITIA